MEAIIFAFITYVSWGIGDLFGAISTRKVGSYSAAFWRMLFGVLLSSIYIPFALDDLQGLTASLFVFNVIIGVIGVIGLIAFYKGMEVLNPALAGAIGSAFPFVAILISWAFLNERISLNQLIAIIVIGVGLILCSIDFGELRKKLFVDRKIIWPIVAAIIFGIYFVFIKIPVSEIGWFWPSFITMATFPVLFLFIKATNQTLNSFNKKKALVPLLVLTVLWTLGEFSYNFAISHGFVSVVAPIAGSAPTLFVLLAFIFFKGSLTRQQILGIITTLSGIVLLSFFSV